MPELTKDIFCTKHQAITPHNGIVDANGEFVFTCTGILVEAVLDENDKVVEPAVFCDRFVKLPTETTPEDFNKFTVSHQTSNEGQVSVEEQEKKLAEIMTAEPVQPEK